jgi:hypothetical protein
MACNFIAYRIAGENKVALTHTPAGATDTGFGVLQGTSRVELVPTTGAPVTLATDLWTPTAIIATLPADHGTGGGRLRTVIAGGCTSEAEFGSQLAGAVSELLFAIAIPEQAQAESVVTLVNLFPGFTWNQARHTPIRLVDNLARETAVPAANVLGGWGSNRLQVRIPTETELGMELMVQNFNFRFGGDTQGVPVLITRLPAVDPGLGTVVLPGVVRPGETVELYNPLPNFAFRQARTGALRIRKAIGGAWTTITGITGWDTPRLHVQIPSTDALGGDAEQVGYLLQFEQSAVPMPVTVLFALADLIDPGIGTLPMPIVARAGAEIDLVNPLPGFTFRQARHGSLSIRRADGGAPHAVEVVGGWNTARLRVRIPTREELGGDAERLLFNLQFQNSTVPIAMTVAFPIFWELEICTIKCLETEDFGRDEPFIQLVVDGNTVAPIRLQLPSMNEGEDPVDVFQTFPYINRMEVRLFDQDGDFPGDDDDLLGSHVIRRDPVPNGELFFNLDDARYVMNVVAREKELVL